MIALFRSKEDNLIRKCLDGNMQACKELYEQYAEDMFAICMRYTKNREEAEDVLQEAFIKIFAKLETYKGEGAIGAWIRRIVINTAIRNYHKTNRLYSVVDTNFSEEDIEDKSENESPLPDYSTEEIMEIVQGLAPRYKMVFNLYAIEDFSHKEIAEYLNISEGTSKSQLSRARAILQEKLKKKESLIDLNHGTA